MSYLSTKTGDCGTTRLGKNRIPKSHADIAIMGLLDCAQAALAPLYTISGVDHIVAHFITETINDIYTIMGIIHVHYDACDLSIEHIQPFIDKLDAFLAEIDVPKVNQFIRPNLYTHASNMARANIRSYEQRLYSLEDTPLISRYLNRLSDCCHAISLHVEHRKTSTTRNKDKLIGLGFVCVVVLIMTLW